MLLDAYIEKKFWGEAVCTANYLQNRLPTKATERTLYELRFRKRPDVSHLHIFGCEAYVHIHKEQRRKLDDKAEKFIFVGYSEESKAYRLLNTETNRVKSSRDVIFLDGIREKGKKSSKILHDEVTISRAESQNGDNQESVQEDITEEELSIENNVEDSFCSANETDIEYQYNIRNEGVNQMQCRRSERTNRGVPPDRYMAASLKVIKIEDSEPRNIKEALSGLYKDKWKNAIEEEIKSLKENGTWDIVPKPKDRDIVTCKWVFKLKRNTEGNVEKYKARLAARGFSQKYGTDYDEVFAPVVRQTTLKTFLAIAGHKDMSVKHFDAKTVFLNGNLTETIYMDQPEGYAIPGLIIKKL